MPSSHYIGKSGHLAVMGELCLRGYNVAMPEIDKGDDVFVVRDDSGAMWRLQVKTAQGSRNQTSRRYQFRVRRSSIMTPQTPELHFVFVMRKSIDNVKLWRFLVMDRAVLRNYVNNQNMGSGQGDYLQIYITISDTGAATSSGIDLSNHLEDWDTWPVQ